MADISGLSIYDEIEIEDMTYDENLEIYHYPCPCGDRFEIGIADLRDGEEIAVCPSCSLMVMVVFDMVCLYGFPLLLFSVMHCRVWSPVVMSDVGRWMYTDVFRLCLRRRICPRSRRRSRRVVLRFKPKRGG